jgi:hypothetical protein
VEKEEGTRKECRVKRGREKKQGRIGETEKNVEKEKKTKKCREKIEKEKRV